MALFAFFVEDGKSVILLLDFVEVPDSHTGARLRQAVEEILGAFGIEDKVSNTMSFIYDTYSRTRTVPWHNGRQREQQ